MIGRYVFVEDTYGVFFHRALINKLAKNGDLELLVHPPIVRRLPAKKCNQAISRKILAILIDYPNWKIVTVIDSEYRRPGEAVKDITLHFNDEQLKRLRVVVVHPMHEAWLCIGLGGKHHRCRDNPIEEIERIIGKPYEKYMLKTLARKIDIKLLLREKDFQNYIDCLQWLYKCREETCGNPRIKP